MIGNNCSAELWNILVEINKILSLLSIDHIVKMNVFVSPFKVMNDSSISKLFLHNEKTLKELNDVFFDVYMAKFCNLINLLAF